MFGPDLGTSRRRAALRWVAGLALLLTPFAIIAAVIEPPTPGGEAGPIPWFVIWIGALIPGIAGIQVLPVDRKWRAALTALYVPAGLFATAWFAIALACSYFGSCP